MLRIQKRRCSRNSVVGNMPETEDNFDYEVRAGSALVAKYQIIRQYNSGIQISDLILLIINLLK